MRRPSDPRQVLGAALAAWVGLGSAALAQELRVAFVHHGTDDAWTRAHDRARAAVEARFGDRVAVSVAYDVPYGAEAEALFEELAEAGYGLIFATSFVFGPELNAVAAHHPETAFENIGGFQMDWENTALAAARSYEAMAVAGHVAARVSRSGVVGYVASFPLPEVLLEVNAVFLAARQVNPDVTLRLAWVFDWYDPEAEAAAAHALIDAGADVILQHTWSDAPLAVAEARGVMAVGRGPDMAAAGPNAHLTAVTEAWAAHYIGRVQAMLDGRWRQQEVWMGVAEDVVGLAPFGSAVPEDVRAEATTMLHALRYGLAHPFTGPIRRADGTLWLGPGETPRDWPLQVMNFFVEGLDAAYPD